MTILKDFVYPQLPSNGGFPISPRLNPAALAYYRYERIIQDIYEFCKELLLSNTGGADRAQSLLYLKSNFLPNSTIAIARQTDATMSKRNE